MIDKEIYKFWHTSRLWSINDKFGVEVTLGFTKSFAEEDDVVVLCSSICTNIIWSRESKRK